MSRSSIPNVLRDAVQARDGGRCAWCRLAQFGHGATFHIDHITPRSLGGATTLENLALQCPNCSLKKANKIRETDPETGTATSLFHPLTQVWQEHFRLERDGTCIGLTPTARATLDALQINAPIPRIARACQIALGLISPTADR